MILLYFFISHLLCVSPLSLSANSNSDGKGQGNSNTDSSSGSDSNTIDAEEPTVELIEELGMDNVYWTAAQLDEISNRTFHATVETLGTISDFSAEQLVVLSKKATEVQWRH